MGAERAVLGSPFAGLASVAVVLPEGTAGVSRDEIENLRGLLTLHRVELARELGAPLCFVGESADAHWLIGPAARNSTFARFDLRPAGSPVIHLDRTRRLLATDAPTLAGVMSTLWRLFELPRLADGEHRVGECATLECAVERVADEVRATHPSLAVDRAWWDERSTRFAPLVLSAADPLPVLQEWVAGLDDGHSFVRRVGRTARMPYGLRVEGDEVVLAQVESDTAGARAGLVQGSRLLGVEPGSVASRVAASRHARPWMVGAACLEGEIGQGRDIHAVTPDGTSIHWVEAPHPPSAGEALVWHWVATQTLLIRCRAWLGGAEFRERLEGALLEAGRAAHVILDLRGNPGGNAVAADGFRARFIAQSTVVGSRVARLPEGGLSEATPIVIEPLPPNVSARVTVVVDGRTGSASEDVVLALRCRPHTRIVGERTAGAIGWVRQLPLYDGATLGVRWAEVTAAGERDPIDGRGIAPDEVLERSRLGAPSEVLAAALAG